MGWRAPTDIGFRDLPDQRGCLRRAIRAFLRSLQLHPRGSEWRQHSRTGQGALRRRGHGLRSDREGAGQCRRTVRRVLQIRSTSGRADSIIHQEWTGAYLGGCECRRSACSTTASPQSVLLHLPAYDDLWLKYLLPRRPLSPSGSSLMMAPTDLGCPVIRTWMTKRERLTSG